MGHLLFLGLHFLALLFFGVFLFFTIPLHLIYSVSRGRARAATKALPSPKTHHKCPDCKELILKEAVVCKHCGCELEVEAEA